MNRLHENILLTNHNLHLSLYVQRFQTPDRLEQHNAGTAARYTRARTPVKLVYQEKSENRSTALKREYAIKQLTRKQKDQLITGKT